MLLTKVGLRERKGRFLPAASLKMESMRERVDRSGSSKLWQGKLSDLDRGAVVLRGPSGPLLYSLGVGWGRTPALAAAAGRAASTDTG